jgi:hypothetical protein
MVITDSSLVYEADKGLSTPTVHSRSSSSASASIEDVDLGNKKLRAAHKKVDHRLLIWYCFVYLILRIDAVNISNTAIMNVEAGHGIYKQLGGITSQQWAWVISIFS